MPDNQAVDLLVSQMLGAWQAGDADGMHKFYADDVMVISGAFEPPLIGWANYARAYQAQLARTSGCRLERINSYTKVTGRYSRGHLPVAIFGQCGRQKYAGIWPHYAACWKSVLATG